MTATETLLTQVLELPEHDRGMIARRILLSLEPERDAGPREDLETAWLEEIERRRAAVRAGTVTLSTWPEVKERILAGRKPEPAE